MSFKADFLKTIGVLTLAAACSPGLESQLRTIHRPEFIRKGEYTIVEKIPPEKLSSLEELLLSPKKKGTSENAEVDISESNFPEVLYHVHKDNGALVLKSMGSSFIVHGDGYFLTAHHVFDKYLGELEAGSVSCFMLLYDPLHGFAVPARPLIFSVQDDVLLGKVDINNYPIKTTPLSEGKEYPLDMVYSVTYANINYLTTDLFKEVVQSVTVDDNFIFNQNYALPKATSKVGVEILLGHLVTVILTEKESRPSMRAFISNLVSGNSGSPVFDFNYAQVGVSTSTVRSKNPRIPNAVIYTEAPQIREMIRAYIEVVNSSRKF